MNDSDFNKFASFCKHEPDLFLRQAKIKLNALLMSKSVMNVQIENGSNQSQEKIVKASNLREYLTKYYRVIFVPASVRDELVVFWESELSSETSSQAFGNETPGGLDIHQQKAQESYVTPGQPRQSQQNSNTPKIFDYNKKGKSKTESMLAAHAAKVVSQREAAQSDIYTTPTREHDEPEKRLDFNTLQKFDSIREQIDLEETVNKFDHDVSGKKSTMDNSNLIGMGDLSQKQEDEQETSSCNNTINDDYSIVIEKHFGANLLLYFQTYFEKALRHRKYYSKNSKNRIRDLVANVEQNEAAYSDFEEANKGEMNSFRHAFRYNCRLSEQNNSNLDAEGYLKDFMRANINLKSLYDFYKNEYYDEGNPFFILLDEPKIDVW